MRTRLRAWMFAVLVVVLALVSGTAAQTPAKDVGDAPGILPSGFGEAVDRNIMTIREATARFKTTEAAEAAGYKRVTSCVQHQPAGAMGYHFQNNDLLDTTLDLEHPEVLVYEKMPDGTFQLNGVEFLVPISAWKSTEPPLIMGQALMKVDSIGFWFLHVLDLEAGSKRSFCPLEPRRQVSGGFVDESLDRRVQSLSPPKGLKVDAWNPAGSSFRKSCGLRQLLTHGG